MLILYIRRPIFPQFLLKLTSLPQFSSKKHRAFKNRVNWRCIVVEPRERDRECPPTPLLKPLAEPPLQPEREADMEKFAADNLNLGGRGLFRRKASVRDLLSWTQRSLQRPLLASSKPVYKQALEMFR